MSLQEESTLFFHQCMETVQHFREEKIQQLKEALLNGQFMIHPKVIASNWLNLESEE